MRRTDAASGTCLAVAFATFALLSGVAARAETAAPANEWRQTVFVYGMGAAIDGDAQVGNLRVPVDVSTSDFFDALKFGAMAGYEARNADWSLGLDLTYMNLGQSNSTQQNRASASLDVEQITAMATVGRRITPNLEALFSLAYFDVAADLRLRVLQQTVTASREANWLDGLFGARYVTPISGKWSFTLRGDIGGGGSDTTWHALTRFTHQTSDRFSWYVGYRGIAYDYEDGKGRSFQRYDLVQHGPGAGISFSF